MPTEHVYEEAKVTTNAKLVSGKIIKSSYTGLLDLLYIKNGETDRPLHKETDIAIKKGVVTKEYQLPLVGPTEETYDLRVLAKYGKKKEKTSVLGSYRVWPKEAEVTLKDKRSDELIKLGKFTVTQNGTATEYATDENGKTKFVLKKAEYTINIKAPLELDVDSQNPKRRHTITVEQKQTAVFVKPDITQKPYVPNTEGGDVKTGIRQYVNMTTAQEGCDAMGSIVEFEVANKVKENGLATDKIYIKVDFTRDSKRNNPEPKLLSPALSIVGSNSNKTYKGYVKLSADGGTGKFKVQLGLAGGDMATISIGYTESDPTDDKIIIYNWRKLGYQLRFAQLFVPSLTERTREDGTTKYHDIPDSIQSVYKGRLEKVFIEYVNIKSHPYSDPASDAPAMSTEGFFRGTTSTKVMYILDGSQNWTTGATAFDAVADNREIHITLCEAAYSSNGKTVYPVHELTEAESDTNIYPDKPTLMFPKKTYKKADEINLRVTGYEWEAAMDKVADNLKNIKPEFTKKDVVTPEGDALGDNVYSVSEPVVGGAAVQVTLNSSGELPQTEKTKLKSYYEACFSDEKKLRQAKAKLDFVVTGKAVPTKVAKVTAALQNIHDTSTKKVLYHPGLDDDGVARKGPMSDVTFDHYTAFKVKIKLPKRASESDEMLPGDYVGAASATKCPVTVKFEGDSSSSINGNAGSGSQLLVLKTATPAPCASTVCHELGHSMGMTVMPQTGGSAVPTPPGMTTPKHVDNGGWYYRDKDTGPYTGGYRNLHKGGHCSNGMPSVKKTHESFAGWSPGASDDICIMWGSGNQHDNRKKYCTDCADVLKARRLDDIRGVWPGRANG